MKIIALSFIIMLVSGLILFIFNGCQCNAKPHPFADAKGAWPADKKIGYMKKKLVSEFDLNADQTAKLDEITADMADRHEAMRSETHEFKTGLIEMLGRDQVSAADLKNLMDLHRPALEDTMSMLAEKMADFHAILTPEQRARLVDKLESAREGRCRFGG